MVLCLPFARLHHHPAAWQAGATQYMMNDETMDTAIAVLERVDEYESECGDSSRNDGFDPFGEHASGQCHPAGHQGGNVLGPGADEMHFLAKIDGRLANEVLEVSPVGRGIAAIYNRILEPHHGRTRHASD